MIPRSRSILRSLPRRLRHHPLRQSEKRRRRGAALNPTPTHFRRCQGITHLVTPQESKRGERERERERRVHGFRRRLQGGSAGRPPQEAPRRRAVILRDRAGRRRPRAPPGVRRRRPPPLQHRGRAVPPRRRRRRRLRGVQRRRGRRLRPPPLPPRARLLQPHVLLRRRAGRVRRADEAGTAAGADGGGRRHGGAEARVVGVEGGRRRGAAEGGDAGAGEGAREGVGGPGRPYDQGRGHRRGRRRGGGGPGALQQPHRALLGRVQDGPDQGADEGWVAQGHRAQDQGRGPRGRVPGEGRVGGKGMESGQSRSRSSVVAARKN